MKSTVLLIVFVLLTSPAYAMHARLSESQLMRLKEVKELVADVDEKSLNATARDIEKTKYPQTTLLIREAMAKTYRDIVREQNIKELSRKEWLYSMVTLNMAYLQFGGNKLSNGTTEPLNKWIRQTLKKYLPDDIDHQPGFHYSIE